MSEQPHDKKIIVDENWKEEAQREKEELARQIERERRARTQPPEPASFALLATTLAVQAQAALGDLPRPDGTRPPPDLPAARFHIDMLEVLEAKTKGNLTPEEDQLLKALLFDLRMRFVEKAK
jgi:hypothetical protein